VIDWEEVPVQSVLYNTGKGRALYSHKIKI